MDIYDQIQRLDELQDFINNQLPVFAEQVAAVDLVALVSNRVINTGKDHTGKPFTPYSKNTVAAWRFWGLSRTQSAEKQVRRLSRMRSSLTYTEFRKINNLKTDKKNFEFTGEMWRKFGVIRTIKKANGVLIQIAGTTSASQKKIEDNSDREGVSIIEASAKEEAIIQQTTSAWLTRKAQEILVI